MTRSREFGAGAQVAGKIDEIAQADSGFDWDIDADLVFTVWYPARGESKTRVLHYGEGGGNVASAERSPDLGKFATTIIATNQGALAPEIAVSDDVASRGRWSQVVNVSDAESATTLAEQAQGLLEDRDELLASWTVVLSRRHPWGGRDDLDVGDTLRLVVQSGRFDVERTVRVERIHLDVDASDVETTTVDLDRPSEDLAEALRSQSERVTDQGRADLAEAGHTHAMDGVSSRAARVYLGASQSISNSTFTKVAFDTVDDDAHGLFDSANNEIVVDKAGWWLVSLSLRYTANSTGGRRYVRIMVNGATVAQTVQPPSGSTFVLSTSDVLKVASGDRIAGEAWQDSGGSLDVASGSNTTWLTAAFIGS